MHTMTFFENIILGFIQGFTEFLPVSSSGHLWIFETLVFGQEANIALEAFLHFATLLAVIIFFRKKLWQLIANCFSSAGEKPKKIFAWKLLLATTCTFPVALLLKPFVEFDLNQNIVAATLFLTGIFILISEYCSPKKQKYFSWNIAIVLGLIQGIAVIPGISRSGITIVFLLLAGIGRKRAVEISFLLSVPTILGAFVFLLPEINAAGVQNFVPLQIAGIVAFCAAIGAIWGMLRWVEKYWKYFSIWCFAVSGTLIFFQFFP